MNGAVATGAKPAILNGIRAAIIDLDGTMLHTAPELHAAANQMRAELGLAAVDLETITSYIGKGADDLVRRLLALDYSAEEAGARFASARASYLGHYMAFNGRMSTPYPLVFEGLRAMQAKGVRLACVTNKPIAMALPLLEQTGLREFFEVVYGGDSLAKKKPDPLPMLQVCADFNVLPAQVVAIGDSSNDAQAARAAGCRILNVPYGYNHGESIQAVDSDGIVNSLLEAAELINND
ncbi:MAG: phosphoglycolate phosphatase [Janthinobacterium lividum]